MKLRLAVPAAQLSRSWDPDRLGFHSTKDIAALEGLVGQDRAVEALRFGLGIHHPGYNVFVAGPAGTGKTSYTSALVRDHAAKQSEPKDWVYVHQFDQPDEPLALDLPPGTAQRFARDVDELLRDADSAVRLALNGKEHQTQRDQIVHRARLQIGQLMEELERVAKQQGFALTQSEQGPVPVPLVQGQPITEEALALLSPDQQKAMTERAAALQATIAEAGRQTWELERSVQQDLRRLAREAVLQALAPVVGEINERYRKATRVRAWLSQVEQELSSLAAVDTPHGPAAQEAAVASGNAIPISPGADPRGKFRVNVLVTHRKKQGAPVVVETNPTYANLFGKADFMPSPETGGDDGVAHIKPGAVHRANGGYLVLQAADLLRSPFAWEALKRALLTAEVRIEVPDQENRMLPVGFVRPQPIALNLKVILIGGAGLFQLLYARDEDFRKLFKLKAEFDLAMEASDDNVRGYARFVASVCRRDGLRHLTAEAVSRVLEHSHRLADDQEKLSARFNEVVEVIYEANAWAATDGSPTVERVHVGRAIREKMTRSAQPQTGFLEMVRRGTILVDTDGCVVGQVNGLTVMTVGDFSFGSPSRITARVYMGQKGILHIEREIAMSGQIHDKGLLTLSAFLGDRFAQDKPLAFSASVAFEQTYVPVDGDSASSTELYALLSALADAPIDQGIAVTGSVNQRGEVQPIGGVNEKVEGYFQVCHDRGLTGRQGVMIPRRNLPNVVLSEAVIDAVRTGQFHIWAVSTVEEGIEILTGIPAGERGADGRYGEATLFDRVDRRIEALARRLHNWGNSDAP